MTEESFVGRKFGNLTVVGFSGMTSRGRKIWSCVCDCGNTTNVIENNLTSGHTKSCGCMRQKTPGNMIDLTGCRFDRLTVLRKGSGHYTSGGQYKSTWVCKCDCGREVEVDGQKLRKGHTTSCGCRKKENKGSRFEDLTGKKFGRLTVLRFVPHSERTSRRKDWLCQCECGNITTVSASKLNNGTVASCGCLKEDMKHYLGDMTRKYKYSNKRLYTVYKSMIGRCYDKNNARWVAYGGRGITVCDEWLGEKGYDVFAEWAFRNGYDQNAEFQKLTIDRIDVDREYSPENCRFVTNIQQQNNRRNNVRIEYNGKVQTIAEWARELNISYSVLYRGIVKNKKPIEYYINDYVSRNRN